MQPSRMGATVTSGEVVLPALVLKQQALAHNLELMASYARRQGFLLAPHGKTTLAPELFRRQLAAGAWGMTVANAEQAAAARRAGAARVLIANEVVGQADLAWLAGELAAGGVELFCLADSVAGVRLLEEGLAAGGLDPGWSRLGVLVELGVPGGRAGVRRTETAVAVAEEVGGCSRLRLAGVEGYEGSVAGERTPEAIARVDGYLLGLRQLTVELGRRGLLPAGPVLVSAGGSKFFDRVAEVLRPGPAYGGLEVRLVVRAGCYLTHDHGVYARSSPLAGGEEAVRLLAALEVWAEVLSAPEPGLAIVGLGKRDASFDLGLPVPLRLVRRGAAPVPLEDAALSALDDQHGYLRLGPGAPALAPGDRVGFGLSHPCTALDRWRRVLLVDERYQVLEILETCFH